MKKGRAVYCVFCDDIRHEIGGKFSLIGIYSGEMLIGAPQFPVVLSKLAIHIWISTPINSPFKSVSGIIVGTSGEELAKIEAAEIPLTSNTPRDVSKAVLGMMAVLSPLQLSKEGSIEVWIEIDGERERAGKLGIKLHRDDSTSPVPTASPPPS